MTPTIAWCILIVAAGGLLTISVVSPAYLDDTNSFLKGFVTHELLGVLGVILAITLASASQVHLTLNRIEEHYQRKFLVATRTNLKQDTIWLIIFFACAVVLLVVKSMVPQTPVFQAIINSLAIILVLLNILVLVDLTQLVFAIEAIIDEKKDAGK
jgi:hypothetical protein